MTVGYNEQQQQLLVVILLTVATLVAAQQPNHCRNQTMCGSVNIQFPFSETKECALDASFVVHCHRSHSSSSQTPYLTLRANDEMVNQTVLNISMDGDLHVWLPVSKDCYNESGNNTDRWTFGFTVTPFQLSMRNKLTVVGFDTAAVLLDQEESNNNDSKKPIYKTACGSFYVGSSFGDDYFGAKSGSCEGVGCCESPIRERLSDFFYAASANLFNSTDLLESHPCGYAFLVEDGGYSFSIPDLKNLSGKTEFPVVLDWTVGNRTCEEARKDHSSYACKSENSYCINSTAPGNSGGYLCNCSKGFQGNPYLLDGCRDVDECANHTDNCDDWAKCENTPGNYSCSCPKGYEGDGLKNGKGCQPKSKIILILIIALSASVSVISLIGVSLYVYWILKKRKHIKLKEQFFHRNGGLLLKQQIAGHRGAIEMTKVFTVEELKEATDNFDESKVLGQGGQGTVYKGMLQDNRTVAIKKSKITDLNQIEQFINEVIVVSQINHRHVVKLLGCCLETKVPLLVYEFIDNGTLYEHLHDRNRSINLSWKTRLRIATETAGALAYLHSAASAPIIHRDVKTMNILLDHNLIAKVSDFGASKIIPLNQTQLTTLVQGTLGYLDPEYFHTSQLTEKSDVYSFGVVLAELLTGKKALSFDASEDDRNLAMYFVSSLRESQLLDIVESHIKDEANVEQLTAVANIAKQCLRVKGEERPTMREVAMELEELGVVEKHRWDSGDLSSQETENLLNNAYATPTIFSVEYGTSGSGMNNSINPISVSFSGR